MAGHPQGLIVGPDHREHDSSDSTVVEEDAGLRQHDLSDADSISLITVARPWAPDLRLPGHAVLTDDERYAVVATWHTGRNEDQAAWGRHIMVLDMLDPAAPLVISERDWRDDFGGAALTNFEIRTGGLSYDRARERILLHLVPRSGLVSGAGAARFLSYDWSDKELLVPQGSGQTFSGATWHLGREGVQLAMGGASIYKMVAPSSGGEPLRVRRFSWADNGVLALVATYLTEFLHSHIETRFSNLALDTARSRLFVFSSSTATGSTRGLEEVDWTNPTAPSLIAAHPEGAALSDLRNYGGVLSLDGNLLYTWAQDLSDGAPSNSHVLGVYDVSVPGEIALVGKVQYSTSTGGGSIGVAGNRRMHLLQDGALVCFSGHSRITVFDVSLPSSPTIASSIGQGGGALGEVGLVGGANTDPGTEIALEVPEQPALSVDAVRPEEADLSSSPFAGDGFHLRSQWQVAVAGAGFEDLVFDSGATDEALTQITVTGLEASARYVGRVRHENVVGFSEWSEAVPFTFERVVLGAPSQILVLGLAGSSELQRYEDRPDEGGALVAARGVTRELAPFGISGEAEFRNVYFTLSAWTGGHVTLTPIVDGEVRPAARRTVHFLSDGSFEFTRRYELALYDRVLQGGEEVGRKGLRGVWFRLLVEAVDATGAGRLSVGGFELEAVPVASSAPDQIYVEEAAVRRDPPARTRLILGCAGSPELLLYGESETDGGNLPTPRARTRAVAAAGPGGEAVFKRLSIPVYRDNVSPMSITATPIVDGERMPSFELGFPGTAKPIREVRHVTLHRPLV